MFAQVRPDGSSISSINRAILTMQSSTVYIKHPSRTGKLSTNLIYISVLKEYILKGVVNAALGQEQGSVSSVFVQYAVHLVEPGFYFPFFLS